MFNFESVKGRAGQHGANHTRLFQFLTVPIQIRVPDSVKKMIKIWQHDGQFDKMNSQIRKSYSCKRNFKTYLIMYFL